MQKSVIAILIIVGVITPIVFFAVSPTMFSTLYSTLFALLVIGVALPIYCVDWLSRHQQSSSISSTSTLYGVTLIYSFFVMVSVASALCMMSYLYHIRNIRDITIKASIGIGMIGMLVTSITSLYFMGSKLKSLEVNSTITVTREDRTRTVVALALLGVSTLFLLAMIRYHHHQIRSQQKMTGGKQIMTGGKQIMTGGKQIMTGGKQQMSGGKQIMTGGKQMTVQDALVARIRTDF